MRNNEIKADISIVTPVYNASRFLAETIESVQNQSFRNWEYILVDDCSQDDSVAIIKGYQEKDKRIKLIQLEKNSGAAVARNTGLEEAQGRYIAFIDSDDRWAEDKLADQLTLMQTENYAFTYTNFALISEQGSIIKEKVKLPAKLDYYGLLKNTAIACSTVMIDRQVVGDFRMPLVRKGQDTATWLQIMRTTGVTAYGLEQVLNYYRQVEGSISSDKIGALKRTWNTYRNLEQLSLPKSIYYFCHYVLQAVLRRL